MFQLNNRELRIDILDPVNDAARLGPRFCWGGYIWQVHDAKLGPLVSGPEFPKIDPTPFNGQGLPESFRHRTLEGKPLTWRGDHGVALGAGELRCDRDDRVTLISPCHWDVAQHSDRIEFTTRHTAAGFDYGMSRKVELAGREIRSFTRLTNLSGRETLTLEWFAHPFFVLVDGMVRAEITDGARLAENPGFILANRILTQKRRFLSETDGHMERSLSIPQNQPLVAELAHPALTHVDFETGFAPRACVIWGNDRTFSFEPYLTLNLAPGETREWSLLYRFGVSSETSSSSSRTPVAR